MLSRTADSLYWMARYTERAENTARLIDIGLQQSLLPGQQREAAASLAGMLIGSLGPQAIRNQRGAHHRLVGA